MVLLKYLNVYRQVNNVIIFQPFWIYEYFSHYNDEFLDWRLKVVHTLYLNILLHNTRIEHKLNYGSDLLLLEVNRLSYLNNDVNSTVYDDIQCNHITHFRRLISSIDNFIGIYGNVVLCYNIIILWSYW